MSIPSSNVLQRAEKKIEQRNLEMISIAGSRSKMKVLWKF